jgi:tetratricopeptide (TPR) repeat protein
LFFQWKQKGNAAYNSGDYDSAIEAYTSAIELSPNDAGFYSNRSAAHLMAGNFDSALSDANTCITLQSGSYKGYGRMGAAYYAMCEYDRAIAVYKDGLKICPDEKHLIVGLQAARRARAQKSKASNTVRKTEIVTHASRRKSLQSSSSVSAFVQKTREELLLQKSQIQAQLDLIDELTAMEDEGKLDLLFTIIDRDGDGSIDANELAAALRKRNKDLAFQDSIEHAINMVATHDINGDAKLDLYEFKFCIYDMIKELNVTFSEFAEFLVFQIMYSDDTADKIRIEHDEKLMKEKEEFKHILAHTRMEELFTLFDKDGSNELSFKEVAIGLYQITRNVEESTKAAMDLLLMMDRNDMRTLNYEQFCRLIMAIVATANSSFEEIADDLVSTHLVPVIRFRTFSLMNTQCSLLLRF